MSDGEKWRAAGRDAAAMAFDDARHEADRRGYELVMAMYDGDDPTPDDIRALRMALNEQRRLLENLLAPAAGCEPWADPVPDMPYGRGWGVYGEG